MWLTCIHFAQITREQHSTLRSCGKDAASCEYGGDEARLPVQVLQYSMMFLLYPVVARCTEAEVGTGTGGRNRSEVCPRDRHERGTNFGLVVLVISDTLPCYLLTY